MTSSSDTQTPKKPTLSEVTDVVKRLNPDEFDDPHQALYIEFIHVIDDRAEQFDLTYLGILGAIKLLEDYVTDEMKGAFDDE